MGYKLEGAARQASWVRLLTPTEQTVLRAMCGVAGDEATARNGFRAGEYWAGFGPIMLQLIGDIPEPRSREHEAARKRIQRAIARLIEVGAIVQIQRANGWRHARFKIILDHSKAVDKSLRDEQLTSREWDNNVPFTGL